MKQIFDNSGFVYEKDSHERFCEQYIDSFDQESPPSATSYISYL